MFSAFGFGARLPNGNIQAQDSASHIFALNGDIFKPACHGVEGVLRAYYNAVSKVQLYGPTNFAPYIK